MIEVSLGEGHGGACADFAKRLYDQLSSGYTKDVSAMPIPPDGTYYLEQHKTLRKRTERARRLGYIFAPIARKFFEDDVFEINTSAVERQGRPMSSAYMERQSFSDTPMICDRHHPYEYGVLHGGKLRAYVCLHRCGELALISSILGHASYLEDDIMYRLVAGTVAAQARHGGYLVYNLHSSGTDGLRFFKERLGLHPTEVTWSL